MAECKDCQNMDLSERWGEKRYCSEYRTYYYPTSKADSCRHYRPSTSSSSSCYITTIVHDILGKEDDCEVLDTLRTFRNEVLQKDEKFAPLLYEYDQIGPQIAQQLKEDNDQKLCTTLYEKALKPIAGHIKEKNYLAAITNYVALTRNLQTCFGIEEIQKPNNYDYQKGGHGIVYKKV